MFATIQHYRWSSRNFMGLGLPESCPSRMTSCGRCREFAACSESSRSRCHHHVGEKARTLMLGKARCNGKDHSPRPATRRGSFMGSDVTADRAPRGRKRRPTYQDSCTHMI